MDTVKIGTEFSYSGELWKVVGRDAEKGMALLEHQETPAAIDLRPYPALADGAPLVVAGASGALRVSVRQIEEIGPRWLRVWWYPVGEVAPEAIERTNGGEA